MRTKSKQEVGNEKTPHNNPVEWEQAEGFSKYLISTDGQVYSLERDILIPLDTNTCGYKRAYIWNDNGQHKHALVHRLVYMAHVGHIPKGLIVNHKDENKANNCIENLELLTPSENIRYGTGIQRMLESRKRNRLIRKCVDF